MGVCSILPPILQALGRFIDLRDDYSRWNETFSEERQNRCRLKVGIDVSGWIQKACFGCSHMLVTEDYLTNFGRATLLEQKQKQEQEQQQQQQEQQQQQQQEQDEQFAYAKQNSSNGRVEDGTTTSSKIRSQQFVKNCVDYVMKRLLVLRNDCNLELLVVFDGTTPPIKQDTVNSRKRKREHYVSVRDHAADTLHNEEEDFQPSFQEGCRGASRTNSSHQSQSKMTSLKDWCKANRRAGAGNDFMVVVQQLMVELRHEKISFLVAPYEADGQLCFLGHRRYIDLIVTDDSDLLVHCTPCPIVYKLFDHEYLHQRLPRPQSSVHPSKMAPIGILIRPRYDLGALCLGRNWKSKTQSTLHSINLSDYTPAMLAVLFVLLGCDYTGDDSKVKGVGVVSACGIIRDAFFVSTHKRTMVQGSSNTSPLQRLFDKLRPERQKVSNKSNISLSTSNILEKQCQITNTDDEEATYQKRFMSGIIMYRHPVVYDPITGQCIVLGMECANCSATFSDTMETISNCCGTHVWGDEELIAYQPYADMLYNHKLRYSTITGERFPSPLATHIAEGVVSPRTLTRYETDKDHSWDEECLKEMENTLKKLTSDSDDRSGGCFERNENNNQELDKNPKTFQNKSELRPLMQNIKDDYEIEEFESDSDGNENQLETQQW